MGDAMGVLAILLIWGATAAGWLTHVVTTVQDESWLLLIVGAAMFPIGVLHGWGIWAGIW